MKSFRRINFLNVAVEVISTIDECRPQHFLSWGALCFTVKTLSWHCFYKNTNCEKVFFICTVFSITVSVGRSSSGFFHLAHIRRTIIWYALILCNFWSFLSGVLGFYVFVSSKMPALCSVWSNGN